MEIHEAAALIAGALPPRPPGAAEPTVWADLGAGTGTFTSALAWLLGRGATILAVDRDPQAVAALRARAQTGGNAQIVVAQADFADVRAWEALQLPPLDGILVGNALHYVAPGMQRALLERLAGALRPGGRLVVVEYEGRAPSQWVPFPVSRAQLQGMRPSGCVGPRVVGNRRSTFGGAMYAALLERTVPTEPADDEENGNVDD